MNKFLVMSAIAVASLAAVSCKPTERPSDQCPMESGNGRQ